MTQPNPYVDKRQDFFRSAYERALDYDAYLKTAQPHELEKWKAMEERLEITPAHRKILEGFKRTMPVLVMSGTWCGDCVRQGPMLHLIEQISPIMKMRFIDNRENPDIQEELRINGAQKVPVVVSFSEDFYEVGRFGDRHLSVYRRKAATELGAACDPGLVPPDGKELQTEVGEWVEYFERLQLLLRLAPALRKRYND